MTPNLKYFLLLHDVIVSEFPCLCFSKWDKAGQDITFSFLVIYDYLRLFIPASWDLYKSLIDLSILAVFVFNYYHPQIDHVSMSLSKLLLRTDFEQLRTEHSHRENSLAYFSETFLWVSIKIAINVLATIFQPARILCTCAIILLTGPNLDKEIMKALVKCLAEVSLCLWNLPDP